VSTPQLPALHSRRIARLVVMWLLTLVLPLQGTAAVVFGAMGPAHGHRAASAPAPVLEDFRRWRPTAQRDGHVLAALGHFHAGNGVQRHHHVRNDASVVPAAAEAGDAEEAATASAVPVLALIPAARVFVSPERVAATRAPSLRAVQTRCVAPLDRPPRATA